MHAETRRLGWLALALFLAHAAELCLRFPPQNLLWSCNLACAAIAAGLLAGAAAPVAAGAVMLTLGNAFWAIDLAGRGELLPTAPLTHVGVWGLGLAGARRLGVPRGAGALAWAGMLAATGLARVAGAPSENVNLAHAVPRGWEGWFPSHPGYIAVNAALLGAAALALEAAMRRWLARAEAGA